MYSQLRVYKQMILGSLAPLHMIHRKINVWTLDPSTKVCFSFFFHISRIGGSSSTLIPRLLHPLEVLSILTNHSLAPKSIPTHSQHCSTRACNSNSSIKVGCWCWIWLDSIGSWDTWKTLCMMASGGKSNLYATSRSSHLSIRARKTLELISNIFFWCQYGQSFKKYPMPYYKIQIPSMQITLFLPSILCPNRFSLNTFRAKSLVSVVPHYHSLSSWVVGSINHLKKGRLHWNVQGGIIPQFSPSYQLTPIVWLLITNASQICF